MALRNIVTVGDAVLNQRCREITSFDQRLHTLLDDMGETLLEANGVGLAAPQVGVLRRAVVVDTGGEVLELMNPVIMEHDGEQKGPEGCLSVPGKYGIVTRPMHVKVKAQDRFGEWYEAEAEELIARAFCHELDHLEGHLYTEIVERMMTETEIEELFAEKDEEA